MLLHVISPERKKLTTKIKLTFSKQLKIIVKTNLNPKSIRDQPFITALLYVLMNIIYALFNL